MYKRQGFIGPVNQNADCIVLFDRSLKGTTNLVCGANEVDYHYTGLNTMKHFAGYGAPIAGKEYNSVDMSMGHFANFYMPDVYKRQQWQSGIKAWMLPMSFSVSS